MLNTEEKNFESLGNLFTGKDFYFLNSLDKEIELIDNQIRKQEKYKEIIADTKNYLENNLAVTIPLAEVENYSILINFNITSLYNLKESLSHINSGVVNLLIAIETHPYSPESYTPQVDKLKEYISNYSNSCDTTKQQISANDLHINEFLNSERFKGIFSNMYSQSLDNTVEAQTSKSEEPNTSTSPLVENVLDSFEGEYSNNILRVSEKENRVYLPYSNNEIISYLTQYPDDYKSPEDVIKKEFIVPLDYYMKHSVLARFRETYSLIRDREAKSIIEALKYSMNLMFTYELNPAIIAACKTEEQLENYLNCLKNNSLSNFTDFEIKFEVSLI